MAESETRQSATVFLSYSWKDAHYAEQIDSELLQLQISVVRDVRDVKYRQSLAAFMARIREADFAILLISDSYLKSHNCMTEALHLLDERDFEKKLLPVMLDDTTLLDPVGCLRYTAYWQKRREELAEAVAGHSPTTALATLSKLKTIETIHARINDFLGYVSDIKYLTLKELRAESYRSVLQAIGHVDVTHLVELLRISSEPNPEQQETALDAWFERYPATSDAYGIRARIAVSRGQLARAEANFQRALELSPDNPAALNNYGHLLWRTGKDLSRAKDLFERAIASMPTMTEARLNLGVLLSSCFGDNEGARAQHEAVIAFNPGEPRAYNNLANLLRRESAQQPDSVKIRELFETALDLKPNYFDARLNYVNYLSEELHDQDAARAQIAQFTPQMPEQEELVAVLAKRSDSLRAASSRPATRSPMSKNAAKRERKRRR